MSFLPSPSDSDNFHIILKKYLTVDEFYNNMKNFILKDKTREKTYGYIDMNNYNIIVNNPVNDSINYNFITKKEVFDSSATNKIVYEPNGYYKSVKRLEPYYELYDGSQFGENHITYFYNENINDLVSEKFLSRNCLPFEFTSRLHWLQLGEINANPTNNIDGVVLRSQIESKKNLFFKTFHNYFYFNNTKFWLNNDDNSLKMYSNKFYEMFTNFPVEPIRQKCLIRKVMIHVFSNLNNSEASNQIDLEFNLEVKNYLNGNSTDYIIFKRGKGYQTHWYSNDAPTFTNTDDLIITVNNSNTLDNAPLITMGIEFEDLDNTVYDQFFINT